MDDIIFYLFIIMLLAIGFVLGFISAGVAIVLSGHVC
jgi:hypothetical protein